LGRRRAILPPGPKISPIALTAAFFLPLSMGKTSPGQDLTSPPPGEADL